MKIMLVSSVSQIVVHGMFYGDPQIHYKKINKNRRTGK